MERITVEIQNRQDVLREAQQTNRPFRRKHNGTPPALDNGTVVRGHPHSRFEGYINRDFFGCSVSHNKNKCSGKKNYPSSEDLKWLNRHRHNPVRVNTDQRECGDLDFSDGDNWLETP